MKILSSLFLICFLIIAISAQPGQTEIQGNVTDKDGVVPHASLTLVSVKDKNFKREVTTDENGHYRFPDLTPGK